MTFLEAAQEILFRAKQPLHARDIANRAIEMELLSHVGKKPVQTMSKSISDSVAKGNGPFVRLKPGLFGLKDWEQGTSAKPSRPPRREKKNVEEDLSGESPKSKSPKPPTPSPKKNSLPKKEAINKSGNKTGNKIGNAASNAASTEVSNAASNAASNEAGNEAGIQATNEAKGDVEVKPDKNSSGSDKRRAHSKKKRRNKETTSRRVSSNGVSSNGESSRPRIEDVPDKTLFAERVQSVLHKSRRPLKAGQLAEQMRLKGNGVEQIVEAILLADNLHRQKDERAPLFVKLKSGWGLFDKEKSKEYSLLRERIHDGEQRLNRLVQQQLRSRFGQMAPEKLVKLILLLLQQCGFSLVGLHSRSERHEYHFVMVDERLGGPVRTAVVVRLTDGDMVTESDIAGLRGALHRYSADRGLIITTGDVSTEAAVESAVPNLRPVGLLNGVQLSEQLTQHGIGVSSSSVSLAQLDEQLL